MNDTRLALLLAIAGCVGVLIARMILTEAPLPPDPDMLIKYGFIKTDDPNIEHRSYSDTLIIDGEWNINKTLVIDEAPMVLIRPGCSIRIAPGASILIRASVKFEWQEGSTTSIKSTSEDRPFGVFGVDGRHNDFVNMHFVELSGGSSDTIAGEIYSGALSISNCNTHILGCRIFINKGEDGLHVLNSSVEISASEFFNNSSDQVDLDNCEAKVWNCIFKSTALDANGDGLDLSASMLELEDCLFEGINDKGISAGEKSKAMLHDCRFINNNIAIASKDHSEVSVRNSSFSLNRLVFAAYQKKKKYGGALIFEQNNQIDNGQKRDSTDAISKVVSVSTP